MVFALLRVHELNQSSGTKVIQGNLLLKSIYLSIFLKKILLMYSFLAMLGLYCVAFLQWGAWGLLSSCGLQVPCYGDFTCYGAAGSRAWPFVVMVHWLSYPAACGIFLDQRSNPCPLHWQVDSLLLDLQGSLKSISLNTDLVGMKMRTTFFSALEETFYSLTTHFN